MREILFRGKRIDNGEWVEGFFVAKADPLLGIMASFILTQEFDTNGTLRSNMDWYKVDPETVGRYTGLTDKNGKKIFEGDLLNGFQYPFYHSKSNEHNYYAEVIWFPGNCAFGFYTHKHPTAKVSGISAKNADFIEDFDSDDWEIIGNIHDNPELLEEG